MNELNVKSILVRGCFVAMSLLQVSCSVFGIRSEENPKYEVLSTEENKEIRSYAPYIVAKTTVKGEYKQAQNEAFRILAGYIFGDNERKQKISMTAPVVVDGKSSNEKISMTAPVMQTPASEGWVMTFMMPSKYKMDDLPTPKDKRVQFEEVPAKVVGVIRYSGTGRESSNAERAQELKDWLLSKGQYEIVSGPSYAGYDPPWTIPWFRRNEMMFEVKAKK